MADKNKVQFGLEMVHYALVTEETGADGAITVTYAVPEFFPGAVSLSIDPEGEITPFYADNRVYYQDEANNGYTGTLTMAYHSDKFAQDVFGNTFDAATGLLVESISDKPKQIALLYEFKGDVNATRHVLYSVRLGRPTQASQTIAESKEITTVEYPITATAAADTGQVKAKVGAEGASYASFFSQVQVITPEEIPGA